MDTPGLSNEEVWEKYLKPEADLLLDACLKNMKAQYEEKLSKMGPARRNTQIFSDRMTLLGLPPSRISEGGGEHGEEVITIYFHYDNESDRNVVVTFDDLGLALIYRSAMQEIDDSGDKCLLPVNVIAATQDISNHMDRLVTWASALLRGNLAVEY